MTTHSTLVRPGGTRGLGLVAVRVDLWRVTDQSGRVLGHIERRACQEGERYSARRLLAATRTIDVGHFWRIDDALDCFR